MNFYILDNDSKIIHLLSNIIENDFNNTVVGTTSNPQPAGGICQRCRDKI